MAAIRRQISIATNPRSVWKVLTSPEGWMSWYADDARLDARKGGRIALTIEDEDGEPVEEFGTFLTFRPTSRLEIAWDRVSPASTRGTRVTFSIARDGEETRVGVVHSGAGVLDDEAARAELDTTWRQALSALRDSLES